MRILVLNPNTSQGITDRLMAAARPAAAAGTELVALTAPRGFPYIATRAEAQIGGAVALEMLAEQHGEFDAAIIAAFGDLSTFRWSAWPRLRCSPPACSVSASPS